MATPDTRYQNYVAACDRASEDPHTTTPGRYFTHISDGEDWGIIGDFATLDEMLRDLEDNYEYGSLQFALDLDTNQELNIEIQVTARVVEEA